MRHDPAWMQGLMAAALIGLLVGGCGTLPELYRRWENRPVPPPPIEPIEPPDAPVIDNPVEPIQPVQPSAFSNPAIPPGPGASEMGHWKAYVPPFHSDRRTSVRVPSCFARLYGCTLANTACLVNGEQLTDARIDTGDDGQAMRLSWSGVVTPAWDLPDPTFVEIIKNGERLACCWIPDPARGVTPESTHETHGTSRGGAFAWPETVVLP